ncbi:ABC transporter ATP-binding protein [Ensifer aridi]|uniref:ABC transporter ATP-binding protein n=1 Tax=Ensifer aridi TaxID=1708715 RepID=UPI000A0F6BAD|nr:ATP-binding cassette domain-containing protein [Ensifer aridi]
MTIVVRLENIRKRYGSLEVLRGVSLEAHQGEVVSILGSSGSGKSTMLRCINILEIPTQGGVWVAGEQVKFHSTADGQVTGVDHKQVDKLRSRTGMVFQSFNLWPHMTILQNVIEAPIHVLKRPRAECVDEARALLEKVGIAAKADQYPAHLSGGQQQRAAIARALAMQPTLLLFDEPTSALDPELVGDVLRVMRALAEEGRTMLVVTHEMSFARDVSSRVVFLHKGTIEADGKPEDIFTKSNSPQLEQFLGR